MRRRDDEDQIEFLKTFMIIWAKGTKQKFRGEKLKQRQTQKGGEGKLHKGVKSPMNPA